MKKWRNKILSAVLVLSLLLTSSSFAFAVGDGGTTEENIVQIPREQLSIEGFSSQQYKPTGDTGSNPETAKNEGPATNAIDGNTGTFWHTIWTGTDPDTNMSAGNDHDKYIIIDLGGDIYLKKFKLIPRQGQNEESNVLVKNYAVYTSTQLDENNEPLFNGDATTGNFTSPNNSSGNFVVFSEPILARYVKIQATDNNQYATIAELEFFMDASYNPTITEQPQSASYIVGDTATPLTVAATPANGSGSVSYQWYKSNNRDYNGIAIEQSGNSASYIPDVNTPGNYYYYVAVTDSETNATIYSDIVTIGVADSGADNAAIVNGGYYNDLSSAIASSKDGDVVTILKDIDLSAGITISKNLIIESAEGTTYTIKRSAEYGNMFTVSSGSLTLDNIKVDGGAEWSGNNDIVLERGTINNGKSASGPIINVLSNTTFTLGASAVLQNNASTNGGGAISFERNSTVNIKGQIINNSIHVNNDSTGQSNGGAAVGQGTLNVSGDAMITGNYAYSRGGAFLMWGTGTLNITDNVIISNNKCDSNGSGVDRGGAAISIDSGTLNINSNSDNGNVLITKNTSNNKGGGAIAIKTGTININNGCTINNNTAPDGGAIYVAGGIANLNGGTITGNTATTNGGAVYVNAGTLNVGQAGNDFALNISGNTVTSNGSGIYYGGNSSTILNINAKLNLSDEIYLHTNGMAFNVKCDLSGISPIKVASRRDIKEIANISNDVSNKSEALNIFINTSHGSRKSTYLSGSNITISDSTMVISEDLTSSTYYKGIENNLYTVTGATNYTWYEKGEDGSFRTVDMDTLSNGEHTVYCVASDGTNYMVSDVATVTVKDFVPCSKAIDKFKNI